MGWPPCCSCAVQCVYTKVLTYVQHNWLVSQDSFHGAKGWVKELKRRGDPNVVIALAGNKADLHTKRKVDAEVEQCLAHLVFEQVL